MPATPYATQADMEARFDASELVQLTDKINVAVIDAAKMAAALGDASAQVDGILGARYALPLSPVPDVLVGWVCDIARFELYDLHAHEIVVKRRDDAVAALRRIADGKSGFGPDGPAELEDGNSGGRAGAPAFVAGTKTFSDLEGF